MDCEICKYFEEHPYVRCGDYDDYCGYYGKKFACMDNDTIFFCTHFEENDEY